MHHVDTVVVLTNNLTPWDPVTNTRVGELGHDGSIMTMVMLVMIQQQAITLTNIN